MAFDPSIISAIPDYAPNPVGAQEQGLRMRDLMDRNQLNELQLSGAKSDAADAAKAKAILKGADYSDPAGLTKTAEQLTRAGLPKQAMDTLKFGQQYQSGQIQNTLDQLTLADKRQELIVNAIDPIVSQARAMKNSGASDFDVKAYITQQMPGALTQLRQMKLEDGRPALPDDQLKMATSTAYDLPTIESWEAKSKAGQAAIKSRLEQFKADTQAKSEATKEQAETERERHDRAQEAAAGAKAQGFTDPESNLLASLADKNVSLPAGLRSQAQIKSTIDGLLRKHPDLSADEIAEGIKSGKLKLTAETKGAQTAGTQIGKVALASNELDTFGDQTLEASSAVPRGKFVPWNQLKNYAEGKISDPALLRFRTKMQALENAYNQLAARSGTDVDKRAHIHTLFNEANSPEAVQTLVRALKEEASGARDAANRTIAETSGSAIPGATAPTASPGAAPATAPTPSGARGAPGGGQRVLHYDPATGTFH